MNTKNSISVYQQVKRNNLFCYKIIAKIFAFQKNMYYFWAWISRTKKESNKEKNGEQIQDIIRQVINRLQAR